MAVYDKKATKQGAIAGSIIGTTLFLTLLLGIGFNVWISGASGMITSIMVTFLASRIIGIPSKQAGDIHQYYGRVQEQLGR
jgi:Na+/proline symporter